MEISQQQYHCYIVQKESRLLDWLLSNVKHLTKNKIKATLKGGGIVVNGKNVTRFDYPLQPGMKIAISKSKQEKPFTSKYIKIVYEDKYLLVIEKNTGILSMAAGHSSLNVKAVLDSYLASKRERCTAHVVHRLDRDTSGLMIYAKDMQTEQILEHHWHEIVFDRRYVAVVSGQVAQDEGSIESWLKDNKSFFTYSSYTPDDGKYALTHYRVLQRSADHTLVEYKLETGRKNQIRVHSADIGNPVCGDSKYGNGDDPIGRLCLHAYMLCFYHPITHKPLEFETPILLAFRNIFKTKKNMR